ncbi:MAG: NAD-dependent epimerase/dehydratase family protein [Actinophytocola sp.]|uniref:NAD-dependent epimerase/dehydratase family protein n=1 Tax=Actinophytocola sp. TaxID=1872138 RepID=UPI001323C515|nr:NAD(P)-dependent oxidoreductase [Actinophytocola sp.]MPZ80221.1 NAD-dependent epimerase/dehydratase family protein [Actinophytocola sp.]
MRLLVVGGCGSVGSMVVPHLAATHEIRVLDLAGPAAPVSDVEYHAGDLHDVDLVARLAEGVDSLVFMAMGPSAGWGSPANARAHLDVAVPGMYATLTGVHRAGVRHMVYTSSMSVFRYPMVGEAEPAPGEVRVDGRLGWYPDESTPPDARDFYGLAKRLGEEVCRTATAWGMDAVCLRLCFPTADDTWPKKGTAFQRAISTSARDVAAALEAALARRGKGFDVYSISGDGGERTMSLAKARSELGWVPRDNTATA